MNQKLPLGSVALLIDSRVSIEQINGVIQPFAKKAGIILAEPKVGVDYLQWSLPGDGWTSFANASDAVKSVVAEDFEKRKSAMQSALEGSPFKDIVCAVPSNDFIYFRPSADGGYDIALTAWAYKYPDRTPGGDLTSWLNPQDLQKVNVAFAWDDNNLPHYPFKVSGYQRATTDDGFMHFDGPLPVGNSYPVETLDGRPFTLFVEKGKEDYVFDLTQRFTVLINVEKNGSPLTGAACRVAFNGSTHTVNTDAVGAATLVLPLVGDGSGKAVAEQPECVVECNGQQQEKTPVRNGDVLTYVFDFSEKTGPVIPEPVKKTVSVVVSVFRENEPVADKECTVEFEGNTHSLITDENGRATVQISLNPEGPFSECEATCDDMHRTETPDGNTDSIEFRFDLAAPENEPEFVTIMLKDFGGEPLVDMPFVLTVKKKGKVELTTDGKGQCVVPKEWFTHKEKMNVKFKVSVEYQQTHDLHDPKNKKKQK